MKTLKFAFEINWPLETSMEHCESSQDPIIFRYFVLKTQLQDVVRSVGISFHAQWADRQCASV